MIFKSGLNLLVLIWAVGYLSIDDAAYDFSGDWYIVSHPDVSDVSWFTHWKIINKNNVHAYHKDPEYTMSLIIVKEDNDHFILESEHLNRPIVIGSIVEWQDETIEFSSGLKMIRLTGITNSSFGFIEFHEFLSSSIWRYDLEGSNRTLYLSDTLNVFGFHSADIIKTGDWNYADRGISWSLESFNNQFVFSYLDVHDVITILICNATDSEFSGRLFLKGDEMPVEVRRVSFAGYDQIESIKTVLTGSEWRSQMLNQMVSPAEQEYSLMWNSGINFKDIESDDVNNIVFTFTFEPDHTVHLYLNGKLWDSYIWEISKDAEYLIIHKKRPLQTFFARLDKLTNQPALLSLELDYYLYSRDPTISNDNLIVFELSAQ